MIIKHKLMALGLLAITAGCSSLLEPRPDHSRFFILTPTSDGVAPVSASAPDPDRQVTVGVGPIDFPEYLGRQQVVTRSTSNELHISDQYRWGEPLDKNFGRVLSQNLSRLLNTPQIEQYPWSPKLDVDYQVTVNVERFEVDTDGQAKLLALWTVRGGRTHEILYSSQTTAAAPAGNDQAQASAALSADLVALSKDIASCIGRLPKSRNRAVTASDDALIMGTKVFRGPSKTPAVAAAPPDIR